jgi:serine/threonine protein kinase
MKVVRDQRLGKTAYDRFVREIEALRSLTPRDGVLSVIDDDLPAEPSAKNFAWLVMPLAQPLGEALAGKSVREVVSAVANVAETLASLHAEGLAHRDIKPANLFWVEDRAAVGDSA